MQYNMHIMDLVYLRHLRASKLFACDGYEHELFFGTMILSLTYGLGLGPF